MKNVVWVRNDSGLKNAWSMARVMPAKAAMTPPITKLCIL